MSTHELMLLVLGTGLGAYLTLVIHIVGSVLTDPKMRRVT